MATYGNADVVLLTTTTNPALSSQPSAVVLAKVTACNTDTNWRTVSVWRVPNGGSPVSGELLLDAQPIPPLLTIVLPVSGKSLVNMQQLFASASVANVVTLSIDWVAP